MTTEYQGWWEVPIDYEAPVAEWTLEQCDAYVNGADESYGERSAEAGSGAISLGYGTDGAYAAANAVARPETDPLYVEARARLEADRQARWAEERANAPVYTPDPDDIPF